MKIPKVFLTSTSRHNVKFHSNNVLYGCQTYIVLNCHVSDKIIRIE